MMLYVVDASVILKWVAGNEREPDHDKAVNLLNAWVDGKIDIAAPNLWQYEVGNFLGRQLPDDAMKIMALIRNLGFRSIGLSVSMIKNCFLWMHENKITFYDAAYLAVAHEMQGVLVTADEKLTKKVNNHGNICLLKNVDILSA
jgi:predicted nucleic acid-binding protein